MDARGSEEWQIESPKIEGELNDADIGTKPLGADAIAIIIERMQGEEIKG